MTDSIVTRICKLCKETKPLTAFPRQKRKEPDARRPVCQQCAQSRQKAYQDKLKARDVIPEPTEQTCAKCSRTLPITEFWRDRRQINGFNFNCKECVGKWHKDPENRKIASGQRRVRYATEEGERIVRNNRYKTRYGITLDDYERLFALQDGKCAMCGKEQKHKRLAIDHCHKTDAIRGLLCSRCNLAIGNVGDSIDLALKMVQYLSKQPLFAM